jgi:hypothetical protein
MQGRMVTAFHDTSKMVPARVLYDHLRTRWFCESTKQKYGFEPPCGLWIAMCYEAIIGANARSCITFKHMNMGQIVVRSWID